MQNIVDNIAQLLLSNHRGEVGRGGAVTATSSVSLAPCLVVAVGGLGGAGKTTLATAVVRKRPDVPASFDDVFWVSLGRSSRAQLIGKLRALISEVDDGRDHLFAQDQEKHLRSRDDADADKREETDLRLSTERLQRLLSQRRALIVVDDAWTRDHFAAFLGAVQPPPATAASSGTNAGAAGYAAAPGGSALLFTTRNLADFRRAAVPTEMCALPETDWKRLGHCEVVEVSALMPEPSCAFLAAASGIAPEHVSRLELSGVFAAVGTLPLSLTVVGACMRKQLEPLRRPDREAERDVVARLAAQLAQGGGVAHKGTVADVPAAPSVQDKLEWSWRAGQWAWRIPQISAAIPVSATAARAPMTEPPPSHGDWLENRHFLAALRVQNRDDEKSTSANSDAFDSYIPAFRAIALTLTTLFGEADALSFAALGLFADNTAVDECIVAAAWRMGRAPARALLRRLQSAGLAKLEVGGRQQRQRLCCHAA